MAPTTACSSLISVPRRPAHPLPGSPPLSILLVEPDTAHAEPLVRHLQRHGHQVSTVHTGARALADHHFADLVILDPELPDVDDGLVICRAIRAVSDVPIITVTARAGEADRVLGLQAGSDDYLVKPYGFRELTARIDAVIRRSKHAPAPERVTDHGPLHIDAQSRTVLLDDRGVALTRKEFDLLHLLASQPAAVVSRQQIMAQIWQDTWLGSTRTIDTHISSLRSKLGSSSWIITVRGVGFQLGHAPDVKMRKPHRTSGLR